MQRFVCTPSSPIVQTVYGKLRGFESDGIYGFFGIKYARAKRFCQPERPKAWKGVRDALAFGHVCPILSTPIPTDEIRVPHRFWPSDENCLNLNVWTPSLDRGAKKPVMVWFHGGGFFAGSAIEQVAYDGDSLAKCEDMVVVTVNHRLNVFGYLDMSAYGEKYHNSVNAGIADLQAALVWVHENILEFGGDPDNVTIFGQSGGGWKVTCIGQTPSAAGLFHKAILMSGISEWDETPNPAQLTSAEVAALLMKRFGFADDEAEKLEAVPTHDLICAVNEITAEAAREGRFVNWRPQGNDWYLGAPSEAGFTDYYKTVPTMAGTVFNEMNGALMDIEKGALTDEEGAKMVLDRFGKEDGERLLAAFRKAFPEMNPVYSLECDTFFHRGTTRYLEEKAKVSSAPAYSYLFNVLFDYNNGQAAWHCADIPFVFHNTARVPVTQLGDGTDTKRLERQISHAFANFARTGDPNIEELPEWKPVEYGNVPTMVFTKECFVKQDYEREFLPVLYDVYGPFRFASEPEKSDDDDGESGSKWFY